MRSATGCDKLQMGSRPEARLGYRRGERQCKEAQNAVRDT